MEVYSIQRERDADWSRGLESVVSGNIWTRRGGQATPGRGHGVNKYGGGGGQCELGLGNSLAGHEE